MIRALLLSLLCVCAWPGSVHAQTCSYSVTPTLNFGTSLGVPTSAIDVTATITVTCTSTAALRVCLSIPAGSGGASIADRRLVTGSHFVQYQLYANAARTQVWGELGGTSPAVAVDFPASSVGVVRVATVYGRVFAGQTGKSVGTYQSSLTPIRARRATFFSTPPACTAVTGSATTLSTMTARLVINPSCTISANPLNFGTVTAVTGLTATSNLSATCTLNGAYTLALNGGSVTGTVNARRMRLGAGPNTIDYQLYRDAARTLVWGNTAGSLVTGTGTGAAQSISVFGRVPPQGPKPPGVYSDTITATITF